jgi:hypothetical protein
VTTEQALQVGCNDEGQKCDCSFAVTGIQSLTMSKTRIHDLIQDISALKCISVCRNHQRKMICPEPRLIKEGEPTSANNSKSNILQISSTPHALIQPIPFNEQAECPILQLEK